MKPVRCGRELAAILVLVMSAMCSVAIAQSAPSAPATQARVTVEYASPHQFTESHQVGFGVSYDHGNYMEKLRAFLIDKATPMLKPGQHLFITFTNIDLAGGYEPWRGPMPGIRFMSDLYPPRFDFRFKLVDANGNVIRQGMRKLTDLGYLMDQVASHGASDPLRYDKRLLEKWLRRGPAKW